MTKNTMMRVSGEFASEVRRIKAKINKSMGVKLSDVEITKLISRRNKKMPVRIKKYGKGFRVF